MSLGDDIDDALVRHEVANTFETRGSRLCILGGANFHLKLVRGSPGIDAGEVGVLRGVHHSGGKRPEARKSGVGNFLWTSMYHDQFLLFVFVKLANEVLARRREHQDGVGLEGFSEAAASLATHQQPCLCELVLGPTFLDDPRGHELGCGDDHQGTQIIPVFHYDGEQRMRKLRFVVDSCLQRLAHQRQEVLNFRLKKTS